MSRVVDSDVPPACLGDGVAGRPSRPVTSQRVGGYYVMELDCGHTFRVPSGTLVDGWADLVYACPLEHVRVQGRGGPIREVSPMVFQEEERVRRATRLMSGLLGPRLFMEMEALLRELEDGVLYDREDEVAVKGCPYQVECPVAPPDDVNAEDRPCWRCRRRALLARLAKVGT